MDDEKVTGTLPYEAISYYTQFQKMLKQLRVVNYFSQGGESLEEQTLKPRSVNTQGPSSLSIMDSFGDLFLCGIVSHYQSNNSSGQSICIKDHLAHSDFNSCTFQSYHSKKLQRGMTTLGK